MDIITPSNYVIATNNSDVTNVDDVITPEIYVLMVLLACFSVIGSAGNALVLYVFAQKRDRQVSTLCIMVLAALDFVTCLVLIPYTMYLEFVHFHVNVDVVCKLYQFFLTFNTPFSALMMVAIAVDRYLSICHPFLMALNTTRAKVMIGALGMFSAGLGLCIGLMYGVYQYVPLDKGVINSHVTIEQDGVVPQAAPGDQNIHLSFNTTHDPQPTIFIIKNVGFCTSNDLIFSHTFYWIFQKLYATIFLLCVIIVIVLYALIYRTVLVHRSRSFNAFVGRVMSNRRESETNMLANIKTAAILFVVTVVFVVTYLPTILMALMIIPYQMTIFYMYFANNVANPFIYSFMNQNFRDDTKKLFCKRAL